MTAPKSTTTLLERYARAAQLTMPKVAARTPRAAVEGYWTDADSYFFLAETFHTELDQIVVVPSIAHGKSGVVEPVIDLDSLAALIKVQSHQQLTLQDLAAATFDMPDPNTLALSAGGWHYRFDRRNKRLLSAHHSWDVPALYSPDERYACFVRDYDLWLKDRASGAERPLTHDGCAHWAYGQQSETCLGALSYRKRPSPVGLWSPDSQWFITHRIDERNVPGITLVENVPPDSGKPIAHRYKYPVPGDPLPVGTCIAIHVASGRTVIFADAPFPITAFSPFTMRRIWFGCTGTAWLLRFDRYCRQVDLLRLDLEQARSEVVISERVQTGYIDVNAHIDGTPNIRTLEESGEIIWFSERDGWGHLYLYDAHTGALKNRITDGQWLVRDIVHVDPEQRVVLFLAGARNPKHDPARKSLCKINFDGTGLEVLLSHDGDIYASTTEPSGPPQERPSRPASSPGVSPTGQFAVVRYGNVERGNQTKIVDLRTREGFTIATTLPTATAGRALCFSAIAADGVTPIHGTLFLPSDFDERRRYPLIDYIYPGPQVAHQPQSYATLNATTAQSLAELGFVTLMLDTRGTPVASRTLHQSGYGSLLEPQLADHVAAIKSLCKRHSFLDGSRIGAIGQSAGGPAVAGALAYYGDLFKVGVAVCGVYEPALFSAVWSDKYRGPDRSQWVQNRPEELAQRITGKLLLVSGDMDENVHVSQTFSMANELTNASKAFDLLIVPKEGHALLAINGYAQKRIWDYFVLHLLDESPPAQFELRFEAHELQRLAQRAAREGRQ